MHSLQEQLINSLGVKPTESVHDAPRKARDPLKLLQKLCTDLARGKEVDQRQLNSLTDEIFDPESKVSLHFEHSKQLEERLHGWARAALRDVKPRPYLRRLIVFKEHLTDDTLEQFLAERLAEQIAHHVPRDQLHVLARTKRLNSTSFEKRMARAYRVIRQQDLQQEQRRLTLEEGEAAQKFLMAVGPSAASLESLQDALQRIRGSLEQRTKKREQAEARLRAAMPPPAVNQRLLAPLPSEEDFALCAVWANVKGATQVRGWNELVNAVGSDAEAIRLLTARLGNV